MRRTLKATAASCQEPLSSQERQYLSPSPVCRQVVARCKEDILRARGVKPTLSPNLNVLATIEALDVKRLLFIGVGCQVGSPCYSLHHLAAHRS